MTSPPGDAPEVLDELGFYLLAGPPESPRELLDEVVQGEALGLSTAFISERPAVSPTRASGPCRRTSPR